MREKGCSCVAIARSEDSVRDIYLARFHLEKDIREWLVRMFVVVFMGSSMRYNG